MYFFKQEKHFILGNMLKHDINTSNCADCYFRNHFCREFFPCNIVNDKSRSTSVLVLWK